LLAAVLVSSCARELSEKEKEKIVQLSNEGLVYLEANELDSAESRFLEVIGISKDEASGYGNLGIVYLRMDKLDAAEARFLKGRTLEPDNIEIIWNLATLYRQTNREEEYIGLLRLVIDIDPDNLAALHTLSTYLKNSTDTSSMVVYGKYLRRMIEQVPTNIVPRIFYLEYSIKDGNRDQALNQLEEMNKLFPEWDGDAGMYQDSVLIYLQSSDLERAKIASLIFHNVLKSTSRYRSDVLAIKGNSNRVGVPVFSFRDNFSRASAPGDQNYLNVIFMDATEASKIAEGAGTEVIESSGGVVTIGDLDSDGVSEIFYASSKSDGSKLFKNNFGRFEDIGTKVGISFDGKVQFAQMSDYDNDGHPDLYVISENGHFLFNNESEGRFRDVTKEAQLGSMSDANHAVFFDADHDGDLDLFVARNGPDKLFRNNGNNTFSEFAATMGLSGDSENSTNALIGDYDSDGDIDLIVSGDEGIVLFLNDRMGRFRKSDETSGLAGLSGISAIASSDFNNDGSSDLFVSSDTGKTFFVNNGNGKFETTESLEKASKLIDHISINSARFLDYDNDGYQDLFVVGESGDTEENGISLLRNDPKYGFQNAGRILPPNLTEGTSIAVFDYNEDGDEDILVTNKSGLTLLRNDGGSANHYLKIRLVGLREGSGKNNYFGIGAKIEVRAGDLYQFRTVSEQDVHFGLGSNENVDIVRILWPNGAPQDIFSPMNDRDMVEQQKLKGSCPFLYTWNGENFVFVKDIMWRSALGMPLGIMTSDESRVFAFPGASRDYIRIPGEMLNPSNGNYELAITGELWETIYFDEMGIYAVDHPAGQDFRLDEKFVAPPYPGLEFYSFNEKLRPVSVTDGINDLYDVIAEKDDIYSGTSPKSKFQGVTEMTTLVIDMGKGIPTENLHLFLNGWIFPSDASINVAISQSNDLTVVPPYLQVLNNKGEWQTVIENLGFPLGKDKTVITDLSEVFKTKDRKIRITTNMQIYWDEIFYAYRLESVERITEMKPTGADFHYRGFSREYRKGKNGPHWFDYNETTKDAKWLDLEGYYTRYGDVLPLLDSADNQYIIANAGDEVLLRYPSGQLPELPAGWQRDFVIYSVGWVKDGDLNTAHGQTVTPLPFHGMKSYPYSENERYPMEQYLEYHKKYNTRWVDSKKIVNGLSNKE